MENDLCPRKPYPSDVSDEEWSFVVPYLSLMSEDAPQRRHDLREVFNALRWIVRAGAPWRLLPNDFPRWEAVYQQTQRWITAGCFAAMVHDLRAMLRWSAGRADQPTAVIIDSATRQSTPESGHRAGYDGHKKRKGSKIHAAVDTLGDLLAVQVTPANASERAQIGALAAAVQEVTGQSVELGFVDQGYTGEDPAAAAAGHSPRSRQAARRQDGVRVAAPALGGGALLRLGDALPAAGQRLRTVARNGGRLAFCGLRLPDAASIGHRCGPKSITRSSTTTAHALEGPSGKA